MFGERESVLYVKTLDKEEEFCIYGCSISVFKNGYGTTDISDFMYKIKKIELNLVENNLRIFYDSGRVRFATFDHITLDYSIHKKKPKDDKEAESTD